MNTPYGDLPIVEAEARIRDEMRALTTRHLRETAALRLRRGQRLQLELDRGRTPTEVGAEIGVSAQFVYALARLARSAREASDPVQYASPKEDSCTT